MKKIEKYPDEVNLRVSSKEKYLISRWHNDIFEACDIRMRLDRDIGRERIINGLMAINYSRGEAELAAERFEINSFIVGACVGKLHAGEIDIKFEKLPVQKEIRKEKIDSYFG